MATYISLLNWTDQGIRNFSETVQRADAAKALAQRMGGSLTSVYWTVGQYDLMTVADFPDDETGTAFLLALGSQGNVRSTTLRAYNAGEVAGVISKLSGVIHATSADVVWVVLTRRQGSGVAKATNRVT
jgi:uncharacterized protein with GYD domain